MTKKRDDKKNTSSRQAPRSGTTRKLPSAKGGRESSQSPAHDASVLRSSILDILNRGMSCEASICELLSFLGDVMRARQTYIFERHHAEDGKPLVSIRYEWSEDPALSEIDNPYLKNLPYLDAGLSYWEDVLLRGELFHANVADLSERERKLIRNPNTRSILLVALMVDAKPWGILGLDDYSEREWSDGEIEVIRTCATYLGGLIKRADLEVALRESEERWNFALAGSGDGVWDWNINRDEVYYSHRYREILGFGESDDFASCVSAWADRIHPDFKNQLYRKLQQYLSGNGRQESYEAEYKLRTRDGSYKWVLDRGKVVTRNHDGTPARMVGTITDISDNKKHEEILIRRSKLLEIINSGETWSRNIDLILTELGEATGADSVYIFELYKRGGRNMARITNEWTASGVRPKISEPSLQNIDIIGAGLGRWQKRLRAGDTLVGNLRDFPERERRFLEPLENVSSLIVPIFVSSEPWGIIGFKSVTEREWPEEEISVLKTVATLLGETITRLRAENALRESERMYRDIVELSQEGFLLTDENDVITFASRRMGEILGISSEKLAGTRITDLLGKIGAAEFGRACSKRLINHDIDFIRSDGRLVHTKTSAAPVTAGDGRRAGRLAIVTDITDLIRMQQRVEQTRKEVFERYTFNDIIGKSKSMQEIFDIIPVTAESSSNVLIEGASGTGKNLLAKTVHNLSGRRRGPFVVVNCGAIPETLLESELFGYARGAFTDARRDKPGRFHAAAGGTIFLDEISELPMPLQVKLLRVIEDKQFEPLGTVESVKADVRVIAATNKNLHDLVRAGKFREDLYYRLKIIHLRIPPLIERREDVELLTERFIGNFNRLNNREIGGVSQSVRAFLAVYDFPGNVRELQNMLEHAFIFCRDSVIDIGHFSQEYRNIYRSYLTRSLPEPDAADDGSTGDLSGGNAEAPKRSPRKEAEMRELINALRISGNNRVEAAKKLGLSRMAIWRRMKKYDLLAAFPS